MSPSTFYFDLSGAIPWFIAGVLTTLILTWLRHLLSRQSAPAIEMPERSLDQQALVSEADQQLAEHTARFEDDLGAAKTEAMRFANDKARLEAELRVAKQTPSIVPDLQSELEKIRRADILNRNHIADLSAEITPLRRELDAQTSKVRNYEADIARLQAETQQAARAVALKSEEAARLQNQASTVAASGMETAQLKSEVARLQAALNTANGDASPQKAEIARWQSIANAASAEAAKFKTELTGLNAQLATHATELANKSQFLALRDAEIDRLEKQGAAQKTTAVSPETATQLASVKAELQAKTTELENSARLIAVRDAELDRLEKLVAAHTSSPPSSGIGASADVIAERDQLKRDMQEARAAYEKLKTDNVKAEKALYDVGPELEQLRKFHTSHATEIERLGAQAASLSKDLENYRRFKDALEAANKIAGNS